MPRSPSERLRDGKEKEETTPPETVTKCDQCIMFMNDSLYSAGEMELIKLKHPRMESPAMYIIDKNKSKIYEMNSYDEGHRSWFIGDTVLSNGRIYLVSPVDVTYLILPYLMKAERNVPLDHLLEDSEYSAISYLADVAGSKDFSHVADRKGSPELKVWRYNEESTLKWLVEKVNKLSSLLQDKKIPTSAAQSFTYVRTMDLEQTQEAYKALAHGIISDYLPDNLSKALHTDLKLPETAPKKTNKGSENQPPPNKKHKAEGPTEDYSKTKIEVDKNKSQQSAKAKALAKSAAGTKNIMSFFSKK